MERMERALEPVPAAVTPDSVVAYCWRGGLRSRAVIAFLRGLGYGGVLGIDGGYRAYRRCVRARIGAWRAPPSFVLRGLTGVGKTLVLRALAARRPEWVLDLEALAGHRSSILGAVGLEPASQKLFESRLGARIARGFGAACVVEGESRKVGDLVLPEPVWHAIDGGVALELVAEPARRVRVLLDDYLASPASRAELAGRLPFIEARLGPRWSGALVAMLAEGREAELVEVLLARYYDPLYRHSERGRSYAARFDARDPGAAAAEIEGWIERQLAPAHELRGSLGAPALADL
jgi:tRNA 2-selenouridine synthase